MATMGAYGTPATLAYEDFPLLFRQADQAASRAQTRFFRSLGAELLLLLFASLAEVFTLVPAVAGPYMFFGFSIRPLPIAELVAAGLIGVALLTRLFRYRAHLDTKWYEARAVAESAKSLTWRYVVGGDLFGEQKTTAMVDATFRVRLQETLLDLSRPVQGLAYTEDGQITEGLRHLRDRSLADRQQAYLQERVIDQRDWYARKQRANKALARRAQGIAVSLEVLSILLAVAQALGWLGVNLQTLATAILAGVVAWGQAHRYQDLSASYDVAAKESREMEKELAKLAGRSDEQAWADFVEHAETAFSREHRLWRATRGD